jgi:hypothetical protein
MIKLKTLLEITNTDLQQLLDKIQKKEFTFIAGGDNGKVYQINDEDKCFKITGDYNEIEVASVIVGRQQEFSCFIPIYYVNEKQNLIIMANADTLPERYRNSINEFLTGYKQYSREMQGESSIFDYLDAEGARNADIDVVNFLRALQRDIQRTGIDELELDLDFSADNCMMWSGKIVLVDW